MRTVSAKAPRSSRWLLLLTSVAAAVLMAYLLLAPDSAGAATVTLLPSTDLTNPGGWSNDTATVCNGTPVATCAGRIDEDIDFPVDSDYAQSPIDPVASITEVTLSDAPDDLSTLSSMVVRYRAYRTGTKTSTLTVSVVNGMTNTVIGVPTVQTLSGSATTYSYTLSGLSLTQAEVDSLYVRMTAASSGAGTSGRVIVTTVNIDTTHTTVTPNPVLAQTCGIDMVLAIDSSGSIDATELAQLKAAFNNFVDALLPGTPTQMAVIDFDTDATLLTGFTNNTTTLHSAINGVTSGGLTNWEDPLREGRLLFPNRADKPDLIVFGSDGDPNTVGNSPLTSFVGEPAAVQAAITQANLAKGSGIRIETFGISADPDVSNLESISSPDAVTITDFSTLQADLETLAKDLCGGIVSVHKLIDGDGNPLTTGDQTSTAGWTFSCTATSGGGDVCVPLTSVTGGDGFTQFDVTIDGDGMATVNIVETVQAGYAVISAECHAFGNGPLGTWNGTNAVNGVLMQPAEIGLCTFINSLQKPFTVQKDFVPNAGGSVSVTLSCANGIVAPGSASASEATPAAFTNTGYTGDPSCTATESPIPTGYESTGTCTATLNVGTCTIVNTLRTATFNVAKDFQPDNGSGSANITVSCTSGTISPPTATATEATPASFTITGFTPPASCTAMENPVPAGYTDNQAGCQNIAISNGGTSNCTIVNVLNTATLNVLKDYTPNDPGAPNVTISVTCTSGTVTPASAPANEGSPATFTITGFTPPASCTATETAPPGYNGNQAACAGVAISVGGTSNCTITNTAITAPFQVLKDFDDNNPMPVTVSLSCASGSASPSSAMASEGSPATFTVIAPVGNPNCTATESPIPTNYSSTGTCNALLNTGSCTILNTYNPVFGVASFQVLKNFTDNNAMDVLVSLVCTPGAVSSVDDPSASESDPADFTVTNQPGTLCSASEAVPAGYVAAQAACQNVPLTTGQCTITNTPGNASVGGVVALSVSTTCCDSSGGFPMLLAAALAAFVAAATGTGVWRLALQRR